MWDHCRAIRKALAYNMIEIDWKKRGLEPSDPQPASWWPANEVAWVVCDCTIVTWWPCDLGRYLHPWGQGGVFQPWFWPLLWKWQGAAHGTWSGVIRTNPCSWSPKQGQWSKHSDDKVEVSGWDLALGMNHYTHPISLLSIFQPSQICQAAQCLPTSSLVPHNEDVLTHTSRST